MLSYRIGWWLFYVGALVDAGCSNIYGAPNEPGCSYPAVLSIDVAALGIRCSRKNRLLLSHIGALVGGRLTSLGALVMGWLLVGSGALGAGGSLI